MAHRIIHPIKHAGKIHKPGKVVSWPDDVTDDLVKLGALAPSDSTLAAEPDKLPEKPADPEKQSDLGVRATTEQAEKPAKAERPARPTRPVKK